MRPDKVHTCFLLQGGRSCSAAQMTGSLRAQLHAWGSSAGVSQEALTSAHGSSNKGRAAAQGSQASRSSMSGEVAKASYWLSFDLLHKCWIQVRC